MARYNQSFSPQNAEARTATHVGPSDNPSRKATTTLLL